MNTSDIKDLKLKCLELAVNTKNDNDNIQTLDIAKKYFEWLNKEYVDAQQEIIDSRQKVQDNQ
jgi:hypothetical protein